MPCQHAAKCNPCFCRKHCKQKVSNIAKCAPHATTCTFKYSLTAKGYQAGVRTLSRKDQFFVRSIGIVVTNAKEVSGTSRLDAVESDMRNDTQCGYMYERAVNSYKPGDRCQHEVTVGSLYCTEHKRYQNEHDERDKFRQARRRVRQEWPQICTPEGIESIVNDVLAELSKPPVEHVCGICGCLKPLEEFPVDALTGTLKCTGIKAFKQKYGARLDGRRLLARLMNPATAKLLFTYTEPFSELNGLVLERRGLVEECAGVQVCSDCSKKLNKAIKRIKKSLANDIWTGGILDELKGMTEIEQAMIARVYVRT
jgi:hypothetical protein